MKKFIGQKYEDGNWYDMYYDVSEKTVLLVEANNEDMEISYAPQADDKIAILIKQGMLKIEATRKIKTSIFKKIIYNMVAILAGYLIGKGLSYFPTPLNQFNATYMAANEAEADDIIIKYAKEAIVNNETINKEFKVYLLNFFDEIIELDYPLDQWTISRMLKNIMHKDFTYVSSGDRDSMIRGLAEVIRGYEDASVVMVSMEYYEHYYSLDASFKTRMFDAINGCVDDNFLISIINDGDASYREYLCTKYGITKNKADDLISFIKNINRFVSNDLDKFDNFINNFLIYNYINDSDFLYGLRRYASYDNLATGNNLYSNNLFDQLIKLTINYGRYPRTYFYNTKFHVETTHKVYHDIFDEKMKTFDGNIDVTNKDDRMHVYLYALARLECRSDEQLKLDFERYGYNGFLYSIAYKYFGFNFYSYLSGCEYSPEAALQAMDYYYGGFNDNDLDFLCELFICLKEELKEGTLNPYLYKIKLGDMTALISKVYGEDVAKEWKTNVNLDNEPDNIEEILSSNRDCFLIS